MTKKSENSNETQNPKLGISVVINRFLDKVLLWLIYRRWRMLSKKIDGKTFLSSDYAKRRKSYESLMWEVRKNDL
jgi:hypothetical protein